MDLLKKISEESFMPHGHCYMWNPMMVWLHVISDALIALAYYSIPLTLVYFVRKRKDLAFHWIYLCFAAFIIACGTTHLMEIWNIWHPNYWLSGVIKAVTAFISISTALLLIPLIPKALALPSPDQLKKANDSLEQEIVKHKKTAEHLQKLNKELELKTIQLEAANKEMESFGYSISHDLRAPLRHIHGFAHLLKEEAETGLNPTAQSHLQAISDAALRMSLLIDSLLSFSRMGRAEIKRSPVSMSSLVQEAKDEVMMNQEGRDIEWEIDPLPEVIVDPLMFKQVWINLLSNAVKYTKNRTKAKIKVGYQKQDHELKFFVQDNGVGFDMQHVNKLFGVFQRLHRSEEFEGTGIGLANVQKIVIRHGGRTWAEGSLGLGATFYFTLP